MESSKTLTQTFTLILISLILFILDSLGVLTNVNKFIAVPLEFSQVPVYLVKNNLQQKFEFLIRLSKIETENIALNQKLAQITAENAKLAQLKNENEALRAQLNLVQTQPNLSVNKITVAQVLGNSQNLVIEPEDLRFVKNDDIVTYGNNFIGIVKQVGVKFAKVELISDSKSTVPAKILTSSGAILGNLVGQFGSKLVLEKIEKTEIIPIDSFVQTAGSESIPEGLVLGKVRSVKESPADPFLQVEVESLVDFSKLTTVFVISSQ